MVRSHSGSHNSTNSGSPRPEPGSRPSSTGSTSSGHSQLSFSTMENFGTHLDGTGDRLFGAGERMRSLNFGSRTFGSVGEAFAGNAGSTVSHASSQVTSSANSVRQAASNTRTMANNYRTNEENIARSFRGIHDPGDNVHTPRTPSPSSRPGPPGAGGGGSLSRLPSPQPPDLGLNHQYINGPIVNHPNGIQSIPLSQLDGYKGVDPDRYNKMVNGDIRAGRNGNDDPDWMGNYLAENHDHAAAYSPSDPPPGGWKPTPGAVIRYNLPQNVTVHQVPENMTADQLKQHFNVPSGTPLMDHLGANGEVIRRTDSDNGSEIIVPWNLANQGNATLHGYGDSEGNFYPLNNPPRNHPVSRM
jgi:hypothetical protein